MLLLVALGLLVAIVVYVATGGHVIFLPLLLIPLGIFGFGARRNRG